MKISTRVQFFYVFIFVFRFPALAENCLAGPKMGPGGVFPANPDVADILGDMDFDFENFYFF